MVMQTIPIGTITTDEKNTAQRLAAPFDLSEVRFKPQVVRGNRALALAYVDARAIQDRLDDVLGVMNWQDEYTPLDDGSVICRLRLKIGGEWITKMDVGSPSEQPDGGDRLKAAFSDALKRAAVKFGIGRYLYRLPQTWCNYDATQKQFTETPRLPDFALPETTRPAAAKAPAPPPSPPRGDSDGAPRGTMPANGRELLRRLLDYEARLVSQGICSQGALVQHVSQEGMKAGHGADLESWSGAAIAIAVKAARAFEGQLRRPEPAVKAVA